MKDKNITKSIRIIVSILIDRITLIVLFVFLIERHSFSFNTTKDWWIFILSVLAFMAVLFASINKAYIIERNQQSSKEMKDK